MFYICKNSRVGIGYFHFITTESQKRELTQIQNMIFDRLISIKNYDIFCVNKKCLLLFQIMHSGFTDDSSSSSSSDDEVELDLNSIRDSNLFTKG